MRKVSKVSDLRGMELEVDVISTIKEQLNILDESYGTERNIYKDLGGYVLVLETKEDVIKVKENILKDIIEEYVDNIECEGGSINVLFPSCSISNRIALLASLFRIFSG